MYKKRWMVMALWNMYKKRWMMMALWTRIKFKQMHEHVHKLRLRHGRVSYVACAKEIPRRKAQQGVQVINFADQRTSGQPGKGD